VEKYVRAGQGTDENTIRHMRFACRVTKARNTLSECVIRAYCFSTVTMVNTNAPECSFISILPGFVNSVTGREVYSSVHAQCKEHLPFNRTVADKVKAFVCCGAPTYSDKIIVE
jgi:hypothetical protein